MFLGSRWISWCIVNVDPSNNSVSIETGAEVPRSEVTEFLYYMKEQIVKFGER